MKTSRPIQHRPFLVGTVALTCALLSGCGTLWSPESRSTAASYIDRLLSTAPSLSNETERLPGPPTQVPRGETRLDPKSGLRIDVDPAGLMPVEQASAEIRTAVVDAAVAGEATDAKEAIGTPTDPLRPEDVIDLADAEASTDLWERVRRGFMLPVLESELVGDHEHWYSSRPEYMQRMTERASRYLFHIVDEVERRQMPMELALLPFVESAFNPQATSSARASGMWQFMPATGRDFELKQNLFRDDRRDVLASTRAALDYLSRLHRQFGDWHLALAAYNWGEGNVQRAIKRNERMGLPTDYLSLRMPLETRHYVPKLQAIKNLVAQPEEFNLTLTPIHNHPHFVSVPIQRDIDASLAARLAGLPLEEFKALNPSLNKPVILAAGTPQILLPFDNASLFAQNLDQYTGGPLATWTAWVAPRTMRPADVAKQVGMSESRLREVNRIPPRMLIKAGSALLVPRSERREEDVSEALADNAMMALAPERALRRKRIRAGKRDTVATIARRYRVSAQEVAHWNKTSPTATFKRGQTVVIYVPGKSGKRMAAAKKGKRVLAAKKSGKRLRTASVGKNRSGSRSAKLRVASVR